jgi:hypothetical protein
MDRVDAQLPNNPKGWSYLALTVLFFAALVVSIFAFEQHLADTQFITGDELKQSLEQLGSYSAEATYLSQHVHDNSVPQPYLSAYSDSLQEASDSIAQKLVEHPHSDNVDEKVAQTINMSQSLSDYLNQLGTEPVNQLQGSTHWFKDINKSAQRLEDSL